MTTTQAPVADKSLALHGGPKAFPGPTGKAQPKIGVAEFLSLAKRFGFSPAAMDRLRAAVGDDDLPPGGPTLAHYYTANPKPSAFEVYQRATREKFGAGFAQPVSSGTGALHCAMVAVGAAPGKEVIVPAMGFLATAMAVCLAGGTPVFCDVDESLQIDPTKIEALVTPQTVAIAPTHHWGTVCDMDPIMAVARKHGLKVVEDCAQGPGAKYRGRYIGTIGDVGCFSISCYKIIGGGESGLVLASDQRLFERACQVAESGGLWRPDRCAPPRYEGELFVGTNYRISELEAAVDIVQLQKMDDIVRRHHAVSRRVLGLLKTFQEITPQKINDGAGEIGYMLRFFPATIELGQKIAEALSAEGIGAHIRGKNHRPDWHLYSYMSPLAPAHPRRADAGACPVADDLWGRMITISLDQWWTEQDCDAVAAGINKVLGAYCTAETPGKRWV